LVDWPSSKLYIGLNCFTDQIFFIFLNKEFKWSLGSVLISSRTAGKREFFFFFSFFFLKTCDRFFLINSVRATFFSHTPNTLHSRALFCARKSIVQQQQQKKKKHSDHVVEGIPAGAVAVCVAAGWRHSAAVMRDGALYTWGWGIDGRLGLGDRANSREARRVPGFGAQEKAGAVYVWQQGGGIFLRLLH
jgi:hypothetical protein